MDGRGRGCPGRPPTMQGDEEVEGVEGASADSWTKLTEGQTSETLFFFLVLSP